jgi:hypothetical protein
MMNLILGQNAQSNNTDFGGLAQLLSEGRGSDWYGFKSVSSDMMVPTLLALGEKGTTFGICQRMRRLTCEYPIAEGVK